jgi:hypothetical protein
MKLRTAQRNQGIELAADILPEAGGVDRAGASGHGSRMAGDAGDSVEDGPEAGFDFLHQHEGVLAVKELIHLLDGQAWQRVTEH